jgi:outer membrane receptor for ferrienterochelin and colicins
MIIKNKEDLKPEYSHALSGSLDINKYLDDWSVGVTIDVFNTTLNNVFVLEKKGLANNGDILLERKNGNAAYIAGITINPKVQYKKTISFQCGYTFQNSIYDTPVQWSNTVENDNRNFFRTPNQYGFYVFSWNLNQLVSLNFSGVYTGSMIAQHYAGFINQDELSNTPAFFENNLKIDINPQLYSAFDVTVNLGVQNITNAFQKDFDIGINRDAGYVYGPSRPRTYFLGLSIKM